MTPRRLPKPLVLALVALHLLVMAAGPCLHALPGGDHRVGSGATAPHGSADDCPICQVLSQAQLPGADAPQPGPLAARAADAPARPLPVASPLPTPSRPRAPPAAPATAA